MVHTSRILLLFLLGLATCGTLAADELTTIDGKTLKGTLVAVDGQGVSFKAGDAQPVHVAAKEIVVVDLGHKIAPAKGKYTEIELTDGSRLRCSKFLVKGKKVEVDMLVDEKAWSWPAPVLPLSCIFYTLRGADEEKNRAEWKTLLANRGKRDLYVIRQADGLSPVSGTILEGTAVGDSIVFEREDGQKSELRLSRATGGLVFNQPAQVNLPPTLCRVLDVFGNSLTAKAIEIVGSGIKVTTVSGAEINYASTAAVAKLDYTQGNTAYLSDLEPVVVAPPPEPGEPRFTFLRDRNQLNEPLQLDSVPYRKGLWIHADTTLTYTIGDDFREFKAVAGMDESIANASSEVKLTIEADGRVVYSATVKRKNKPVNITLDVKGVKQLRLNVEAATPYNGNQIILGDARVQK